MKFNIGTYSATAPPFTFLVRFDFDDPGNDPARGLGLNMISGDVFRGNSTSPAKYVAGFTCHPDPATVSGDGETATASVKFYGPSNRFWLSTGRISCKKQGDDIKVALTLDSSDDDDLADLVKTWQLTLVQRSDYLRTVKYQFDQVKQMGDLAGLLELHARVRQDFAKARIEMLRTLPGKMDGSLQDWDESSLTNALTARFLSNRPNVGLEWFAYLLVAPRFRDSGSGTTFGILFDQQGRRGAALFWNSIAAEAGNDFARRYVRTAVHELGHVLNLLHTFDPARRQPTNASASFMNYPQEYSAGADGYWAAYHETFDPDELLFLRHGPMDELIIGGAPYGGHDNADRMRARNSAQNPLRLKLRLKPDALSGGLDFGAPVNVEAKLSVRKGATHEVSDALDPAHGCTRYLIRDPQGRVSPFLPLFRRCSTGRSVQLSSNRPAIYENVNLTFGANGFHFSEPGQYQIRAAYSCQGTVTYSNIQKVTIYPPQKLHQRLLSDTFVDNVGSYLACWGNPQLESSIKPLDVLAEQLPRHPLAIEYQRCKAFSHFTPTLRYRRQGKEGVKTYVQKSRPDIEAMAEVLGLTKRRRLSKRHRPTLSNIVYARSARLLADHFDNCGEAIEAKLVRLAVREHQQRYNDRAALPPDVDGLLRDQTERA